MKYSIVTRIYTEILINQAVDNFTSSRFRESRIQGTNQYSFTKVLCSSEKHNPKNQTELAESYGITQQTMSNYMRMVNMIPEIETKWM